MFDVCLESAINQLFSKKIQLTLPLTDNYNLNMKWFTSLSKLSSLNTYVIKLT